MSRLPDKYRVAIVLCDLEGKTRKEASRHLGVPDGTLAARLARGRKMLAARLARHGVTLSAGALALVLSANAATASVPSVVVRSTIQAANLLAMGQAAVAGGISAKAVALMEGVLKNMFLTKLKMATTVVLGVGLLGAGWGLYPSRAAMPDEAKQEAAPSPPSTSAALDKEGGNPAKEGKGEKKIGLPKGPAPAQALVSLTKDGKLLVKCEHMMIAKTKAAAPPPLPEGQMPGPHVVFRGIYGGIGAVRAKPRPFEFCYDLKEVRVLDTNGKEVEKKELPKRLKDEMLAVAAFGEVDPLHLRILKEGTLVFILPPLPADRMQLPDRDQVFFPGFGPGTASVLFFKKQWFGTEPNEP